MDSGQWSGRAVVSFNLSSGAANSRHPDPTKEEWEDVNNTVLPVIIPQRSLLATRGFRQSVTGCKRCGLAQGNRETQYRRRACTYRKLRYRRSPGLQCTRDSGLFSGGPGWTDCRAVIQNQIDDGNTFNCRRDHLQPGVRLNLSGSFPPGIASPVRSKMATCFNFKKRLLNGSRFWFLEVMSRITDRTRAYQPKSDIDTSAGYP